jgi:ribosome-associated translation inhibitor RaiA
MALNLQYVGDFSRVSDEEKAFINKRLDKFDKKYSPLFTEILMKIDLHIHKETSRGRSAYYTKIHVFTDKGNFNAEGQEFSAEKSIYQNLARIEKQMEKVFSPKKRDKPFRE